MISQIVRTLKSWWTTTPQRRLLTGMLEDILPRLHGAVIDVGGGRSAAHDAFWAPDVTRTRVDVSATHAPDIIANGLQLPIRDGSVDAVVAFEVLEHVSNPGGLISEAFRVLRPGGYLCVSAPFIFPVHGDPDDFYRFTADGMRFLTQAFCKVAVYPYGNHWSAAWVLLSTQSRLARFANPLMRLLGSRPNPRCPGGHVLLAQKSWESPPPPVEELSNARNGISSVEI